MVWAAQGTELQIGLGPCLPHSGRTEGQSYVRRLGKKLELNKTHTEWNCTYIAQEMRDSSGKEWYR